MIGSSVHVEFDDRAQLEEWLNNEPYTTGKVWDKVEVSEGMLFPVRKYLT